MTGAPATNSALPDVGVDATAGGRSHRAVRSRALSAIAWTLAAIVLAGVVGAVLFFHRGDAEGAARVANAELDAMLQPGERVTQRVPVTQRNYWDWFRVTHGVLAATDSRLVYVGVPPEPLLPREPEPQVLEILSLPYDQPIAIDRGTRTLFGTRPAVGLAGPSGRATLEVAASSAVRMDSVLVAVDRRKGELRAAHDAELRASEAALAASRRAITHLVQGGESLEGIAVRYGVRTDSLRTWNQLASDRITAGRRLIVRPER